MRWSRHVPVPVIDKVKELQVTQRMAASEALFLSLNVEAQQRMVLGVHHSGKG